MSGYKLGRKYYLFLIFSVIALAIGSYLASVATLHNNSLNASLPAGQNIYDIGFLILPYNPVFAVIADALLLMSSTVLVFYIIYNKKYDQIPYYLFSIAVFNMARAIVLPLTPLPTPAIVPSRYGLLYNVVVTGGTFPSGQAGHVFLLFLLIPFTYKFSKYLMLLITALISFFLVVSKRALYDRCRRGASSRICSVRVHEIP